MYILNLEDNVFKHNDIFKAISTCGCGKPDIEWVRNLEEGLERIQEQIAQKKPYDLIITDMWYPKRAGGSDHDSGEELIKTVQDNGWNIPIILCSSVNYRFPGILGAVHYSKNEDWEQELVALIKQLCQ